MKKTSLALLLFLTIIACNKRNSKNGDFSTNSQENEMNDSDGKNGSPNIYLQKSCSLEVNMAIRSLDEMILDYKRDHGDIMPEGITLARFSQLSKPLEKNSPARDKLYSIEKIEQYLAIPFLKSCYYGFRGGAIRVSIPKRKKVLEKFKELLSTD